MGKLLPWSEGFSGLHKPQYDLSIEIFDRWRRLDHRGAGGTLVVVVAHALAAAAGGDGGVLPVRRTQQAQEQQRQAVERCAGDGACRAAGHLSLNARLAWRQHWEGYIAAGDRCAHGWIGLLHCVCAGASAKQSVSANSIEFALCAVFVYMQSIERRCGFVNVYTTMESNNGRKEYQCIVAAHLPEST